MGRRRPRWIDAPWLPAAAWGAAAACFVVAAAVVDLPFENLVAVEGNEFVRHLLYLGVAVGLVVPAVLGPQGQGLVRRFLDARVAVWLGLVAYGMFLWQHVVLGRYLDRHRGELFQLSLGWALWFNLSVTILVAAVTYYLVQRPVLGLTTRKLSPFAAGMWCIGLLGLAWRLIALLTINSRNPDGGDPFYYHHQANLLASGRGFAEPFHWVVLDELLPTAVHPPLMTVWLSVSSLAGGQSWLAHKSMAAIAGAGVVVMVGLVGRELWSARAGLVAAAVAAAYPNFWIIDGTLWPEGLFSLLIAAVLVAVYRWIKGPSLRWALGIGLVVGLATLTRGEAILLLPLLVLPVFFRCRDLVWRQRLAWFGATTVVALAVLVPWSVRNLMTFDEPVFVSTNSEEVLFYANCPDVYSGPMIGYWSFNCQERVRQLEGEPPGDESERSKAWRERGIDYAFDNQDRLLPVAAARFGRVWDFYRSDHNMTMMNVEGRPLKWSRIGQRVYWALIPFAAAGLWVLYRRRVPIWPLVAMFALVGFTALTVYGGIRFRTPAEVAMAGLAGVAVDAVITRWRRPKRRARAPSAPSPEATTADTAELVGAGTSARRVRVPRPADGS